jgi:AraC family transcriptional regulator, regulatory protein of adaptative response / methylated-DNA-[protein]-cysteine methyltransferase
MGPMTTDLDTMPNDYSRIADAIAFLDRRPTADLEEVAGAVGLSPFHFHRLFSRWAGTSPKRFQQFRNVVAARRLLGEGRSILDATYAADLSGPGRLHDLMVSVDAVTPGEFKAKGRGVTIRWGVHQGPFGDFLLGQSDRGVTTLKFLERASDRRELVAEMREAWANATVIEDAKGTAKTAAQVVRALDEGASRPSGHPPIRLHLRGTNFQLKVWEALLRIPAGGATSYEELAAGIGAPDATRAAAGAVAANPVVWLIPCHRVIRKTGAFGGYQGGEMRKRALLGWEAARAS